MSRRVFPLVMALTISIMAIYPVSSVHSVRAHMITVPWHQQINALECGDAALEIVFDYWGPDISQKEITDVARTSSQGTYTFDMVRAGQFSCLSNAQGRFYPHEMVMGGYPERSLGYASFSHSGMFWLEDLKDIIDRDIPVIVLMRYTTAEGAAGHYRVVIGYDDGQQLIYFSDPWGRDTNHLTDWTGIISWTYIQFETAWNYIEYGTTTPFFGVVIMPWSVDISVVGTATQGSTITVTANIDYRCPAPFDKTQYPAQNVVAQIVLPQGTSLLSSTSPSANLDAGDSTTATWTVLCNQSVVGRTVSVCAWGMIFGQVPEAQAKGNVQYPGYAYSDAIGGQATAFL